MSNLPKVIHRVFSIGLEMALINHDDDVEPPLKRFLRQHIQVNGPMPWSEFMRMAVTYYYDNYHPFGMNGDFITAPEISHLFGHTLAVWCTQQILASPHNIWNIVELGGGNGTMMFDILNVLHKLPQVWGKIAEISMVERSARLREKQRDMLRGYGSKVSWYESILELPKTHNLVLANEFWDALAIAQYQMLKGKLHERYVMLDEKGEFQWSISPTGIDPLVMYKTLPPEGAVVEVCREGQNVLKQLLKHHQGAELHLLTIDYGYIEPLYNSTVQAIKHHAKVPVFEHVGEADISALVDFAALAEVAVNSSATVTCHTQAEFLQHYGINELAAKAILQNGNAANIHSQLERLVGVEQMGDLFKAMHVYSR